MDWLHAVLKTDDAITVHALVRGAGCSIKHQQRCGDGACADFVIPVGRYKALVQKKRMMKAVFVCVQSKAEL